MVQLALAPQEQLLQNHMTEQTEGAVPRRRELWHRVRGEAATWAGSDALPGPLHKPSVKRALGGNRWHLLVGGSPSQHSPVSRPSGPYANLAAVRRPSSMSQLGSSQGVCQLIGRGPWVPSTGFSCVSQAAAGLWGACRDMGKAGELSRKARG